MSDTAAVVATTRVVIVGSGFAGIGASIALARAGIDHAILERADDVGGTWRDNRYPGCRCDVPSHLYSFSFAPNPEWSETYSPQPEIQAYLRRTAEEHGVVERIRFGHELLAAAWDDEAQRWRLDTSGGTVVAEVLVLGNGGLSEPAIPEILGIETFAGTSFHSAAWRSDHDLRGERVAVIGTGASSIQLVPEIQPLVERLTLFQRTAPWVLPHRSRRITHTERALYRLVPGAQRLVRGAVYWSRELIGAGLVGNGRMLDRIEQLARRQLASQVADPALRARLTPSYRAGCKRLLLSDDWYPAIQQPNVDIVSEKIVEVRPHGVVTADGEEHPADTIIFGTGFRVTEFPIAHRIRGAGGRTLAEHWAERGATAYLGTAVSSFPNLFLVPGPNTAIGHTSLVVMIEAQLRYVLDALRTMEERGISSIRLRPAVERAWSDEIQENASTTVWNSGGCASWYLDAEGRNTTIWPDLTFRFRRRTRHFDLEAYELVSPAGGTT